MDDPYTAPSSSPEVSQVPLSSEERMWAMLGHLSALTGMLTGGIGMVVGPLIIWQIKKDTMPFAAQEAKEALNFNITWLVGFVVLSVLAAILTVILIGLLLWPVIGLLAIGWLVVTILAGLKANEGKAYRYPATIRLIK